jgi:uncharacterized protein involved in exopolysaccharide biosynthesis
LTRCGSVSTEIAELSRRTKKKRSAGNADDKEKRRIRRRMEPGLKILIASKRSDCQNPEAVCCGGLEGERLKIQSNTIYSGKVAEPAKII